MNTAKTARLAAAWLGDGEVIRAACKASPPGSIGGLIAAGAATAGGLAGAGPAGVGVGAAVGGNLADAARAEGASEVAGAGLEFEQCNQVLVAVTDHHLALFALSVRGRPATAPALVDRSRLRASAAEKKVAGQRTLQLRLGVDDGRPVDFMVARVHLKDGRKVVEALDVA